MMENKEKNFISAVVYVHNMAESVRPFLNMIITVLENCFEKYEIICVNDHSMDESAVVIREIGERNKHASITLLNMSYYHGLEMAMNAGVDLAIGDFIFEFDSMFLDFAPEEILKVYRKSLEGYDIVSAVPMKKEKLSSRFYYWLFDRASIHSYMMHTERFRIISRRVVNRIRGMNNAIPYRKALYANCGLRTVNLSYVTAESSVKEPRDKNERRYRMRLAVDTLLMFTDLGYRFSVAMTMAMMFVTVFTAVYSLTVYLVADPVAGWTTTILFLSFVFFGLFGILTAVIKYLQILVDIVFRRRHYSFESIEKLG